LIFSTENFTIPEKSDEKQSETVKTYPDMSHLEAESTPINGPVQVVD